MQQARCTICNLLLVLIMVACVAPAAAAYAAAADAQATQPTLQGNDCVKNNNFMIVGAIGLFAGGAMAVPGLQHALLLGI